MPTTAQTALYLLLGLALTGGVLYVLAQITGRQRRLHAELARLEQLTAEVAMTAEAMLDRIDERIDRLNRIADRVESKVKAASEQQQVAPQVAAALQMDSAQTPPAAQAKPVAQAKPAAAAKSEAQAAENAAPRKRGRPRKNSQPEPVTATAQAPATATAQAPATAPAPDPAPAAAPAFAGAQPATPSGQPSREEKLKTVFAMAAEGKSIPEIAAALSIPRGEVQLILNLRKVTA